MNRVLRTIHTWVFPALAGMLAIAVTLCCSATPAWAQATSTTSVVGQIKDPSAGVVPGADVKLEDLDTKVIRTTVSNEAGRYIFINVPSGNFKLTVQAKGFAGWESSGLKATIGSAATVDVVLKVGSPNEVITVEAGGATELVTSTATIGAAISGASLLNLPNLGRDVSTLAVLQPGVTSSGYTGGAFMDQNTYILDGGNITDDVAGNTIQYQTNFTGLGGTQTGGFVSGVVPTPVESIEEVRVSVFNQGVDFNHSIGGTTYMATKRGTSQFHGSAYGFYYATNLGAANSWTNNHTPSTINGVSLPYTPLASNHRTRFGTALGGPIASKDLLGGKWYFFFNYEGMRYPNVSTYERLVPSSLMRAGIIQVPDSSGKYVAYNLNPTPVTLNGVTYQPASCPSSANGLCDPRGIGLNPVVNQIWSKYMPLPNDPNWASGDGYNTMGYLSTIRAPLTSNNYVSRIDHQFGDKWHLMLSYRYLRLINLTTNQVDIGGALPGDTLGQPTAVAPRPQIDGYMVAGLTTNISPRVTNDARFVYLRQFWEWRSAQAPAQLPGLGGAVEIGAGNNITAESANALIPYNINTSQVRLRYWDGQDKSVIDNVTMLKGDHLFQFGGSYQRTFAKHMRTDNGSEQNNQIAYWVGDFNQLDFTNSPYIPSTVPSNQVSNYKNLYAEALGIVSRSQVIYTRAGQDLALQPIGSVATNQTVIPYYNFYFADTWKWRPSLTLTYGMAYALEMPPYELNGKQVVLVDANNYRIHYKDYAAERVKAALAGQIYNPLIGFSTVRNVGDGLKYLYPPFYGGFSPRLSLAWNPHFKGGILGTLFGDGQTVIRGGYSRIWGRVNAVQQAMTPLLGPGFLQATVCTGVTINGQCLGLNQASPVNAFRIGTDGMTAPLPTASQTFPQPFIPGGTNPNAGDSGLLDPDTKPVQTDNISISIQRQFSNKIMLEIGYMGRKAKNIDQEINIDAVPYMMTLGGQRFDKAFANLYTYLCGGAYPCPSTNTAATVPSQPFFEAALGGATSSYCSGYANCTAAFASKNTSTIKNAAITTLWSALNNSWTLGRSMISSPLNGGQNQAISMTLLSRVGWSNYNAGYISFRTNDWKGISAASHLTWSRSLGTGQLLQAAGGSTILTPWDLHASYGPQSFDVKFVYNASMYWQSPFFKGDHGIKGRLLGGWTISPLFTAQSGAVLAVSYGANSPVQSFGESISSSISSNVDKAMPAKPYTGGSTANYGVTGSNGVGTNNPYGVNMFSDPATVYSQFRPCILGIDTSCGGTGNIRGLPRWNLDASFTKDFAIVGERVHAALTIMFTNVMNHLVLSDPTLSLTSPTTFGRITSQANTPRNMEFGLRISF